MTNASLDLDRDRVDFALDDLEGRCLHDVLRRYRDAGPVQPTHFMGLPAFVISSHAALTKAFLDESAFPGHRMYVASFEPAVGKSFISNPDPKEHLAYRKLATPAFRSRAVSRYERTGIAELAHELIDELESERTFDLVERFTSRFPYLVITRLLGLPRDREDEFHDWATALLSFANEPERAQRARESFSEFLAPVVAARRVRPEGDVISELVQAEYEGHRLDDDAIFSHIRLLFPAGGETTYGSLGNLLYALLSMDGGWKRVVDQPDCIDAAVAEALRWETSIAVLPRLSSTQDCIFEGVKIPANSWVLFAIAGANRDPNFIANPDRFDIDRAQPPNLTFGRGAKSCPGMHLAKKSMSVAVQVLSERLPDLRLTDPQSAIPHRSILRSPNALQVERTSRARADAERHSRS